MWENLWISLNAVIPFVIYLLFGYGLRMTGLADRKLMGELNQLLFKGFFPILMFDNLYGNREHLGGGGRLVVISVVTLAVLLVILVMSVPRFVEENSRRSVVIQALYRSNTLLFVWLKIRLPLCVETPVSKLAGLCTPCACWCWAAAWNFIPSGKMPGA